MPEPDVHAKVCAQMPDQDAPPQTWVDHYLWAAEVYAEHGMAHFVESMRYRAHLWRKQASQPERPASASV